MKEIMYKKVNLTKNEILDNITYTEDYIQHTVNRFNYSHDFDKLHYQGFKEYTSQCYEYKNENDETILTYIMYFL